MSKLLSSSKYVKKYIYDDYYNNLIKQCGLCKVTDISFMKFESIAATMESIVQKQELKLKQLQIADDLSSIMSWKLTELYSDFNNCYHLIY